MSAQVRGAGESSGSSGASFARFEWSTGLSDSCNRSDRISGVQLYEINSARRRWRASASASLLRILHFSSKPSNRAATSKWFTRAEWLFANIRNAERLQRSTCASDGSLITTLISRSIRKLLLCAISVEWKSLFTQVKRDWTRGWTRDWCKTSPFRRLASNHRSRSFSPGNIFPQPPYSNWEVSSKREIMGTPAKAFHCGESHRLSIFAFRYPRRTIKAIEAGCQI